MTDKSTAQTMRTDTDFYNGNQARLNVERVLFHPGMFSSIQDIQIDAYFTRPFGIRELDTRSVLLMIPWGRQRHGIALTSFGSKIYSENSITYMHVLPLVRSLLLTSEFTWLPVSISGYEQKSDISVTGGLFLRWGRFIIGFRHLNLISGGNAHTHTGRAKAVNFRVGFAPLPEFTATLALIRESGLPTVVVIENRLTLGRFIALISEIGANPSYYALGVEIRQKFVNFVYYWKQHPDLGSTSQVGLTYRFRKSP